LAKNALGSFLVWLRVDSEILDFYPWLNEALNHSLNEAFSHLKKRYFYSSYDLHWFQLFQLIDPKRNYSM
jgi:hypothetical protein